MIDRHHKRKAVIMSTQNLVGAFLAVAALALLFGFMAGVLYMRTHPHPLTYRPMVLTAYQCKAIGSYSDNLDVRLRWRDETFDIASEQMRPAGLYMECAPYFKEPIYLAVSPDDYFTQVILPKVRV